MRLTIKNTLAIHEHLQNVFDEYDLDMIHESKDRYEFQFWNKKQTFYVTIKLNRYGVWNDDANEYQYEFESGDTSSAEWLEDIYNARWALQDELDMRR